MPQRMVMVLLLPLIPLILALTFTTGTVLGSNLAQSILLPYPNLPSTPAARSVVAPSVPPVARIFGLQRATALLGGVILMLLILLMVLSLALLSKDRPRTAPESSTLV